jgi:hypothetical protein
MFVRIYPLTPLKHYKLLSVPALPLPIKAAAGAVIELLHKRGILTAAFFKIKISNIT